jgi:dTDP-4-dehydrorhamnose reductase
MKAVVMAITEMRKVNSQVELVQTEDLCKVHSTAPLKYQADFENERRWLTYDILTGKVNREHPLWKYFLSSGITPKELGFFLDHPVIPAVCGFNYYVTSERFLDHRIKKYRVRYHGGNGRQRYADIEAVRSDLAPAIDPGNLLREAWTRFHLPLALTEVHLAGPADQQMKWFYEAWKTGLELKKQGIDFRAVTAWSLLGSFDWDSLLCVKNNHYETGVYDIRSGKPVVTPMTVFLRELTHHPAALTDLSKITGWWQKEAVLEDDSVSYQQSLTNG